MRNSIVLMDMDTKEITNVLLVGKDINIEALREEIQHIKNSTKDWDIEDILNNLSIDFKDVSILDTIPL